MEVTLTLPNDPVMKAEVRDLMSDDYRYQQWLYEAEDENGF